MKNIFWKCLYQFSGLSPFPNSGHSFHYQCRMLYAGGTCGSILESMRAEFANLYAVQVETPVPDPVPEPVWGSAGTRSEIRDRIQIQSFENWMKNETLRFYFCVCYLWVPCPRGP